MASLNDNQLIDRYIEKVHNSLDSFPEAIREKLSILSLYLSHIKEAESHYAAACKITWERNVDNACRAMATLSRPTLPDHCEAVAGDLWLALSNIAIERYLRTGAIPGEESNFLQRALNAYGNLGARETESIALNLPILQQRVILEHLDAKDATIEKLTTRISQYEMTVSERTNLLTTKLNEAEERLKGYQELAKNLESHFNFAAISEAFKKLGQQKRKELWIANTILAAAGLAVLTPLLFSFYSSTIHFGGLHFVFNATLEQIWPRMLAVLPIELILIYFFRIALKSQLSLKAQLLQLQLRYSLCAFIEGYAEFTKKLENTKLEKFEALIFSGLSPDPDNVPSTFDGMDQLVGLVKAARGEK